VVKNGIQLAALEEVEGVPAINPAALILQLKVVMVGFTEEVAAVLEQMPATMVAQVGKELS